jgi:1,6-anhydro-N-acetylmuramate kinase
VKIAPTLHRFFGPKRPKPGTRLSLIEGEMMRDELRALLAVARAAKRADVQEDVMGGPNAAGLHRALARLEKVSRT